ncbi:MAG: hypothetical protein IKK50_01715 [Ruminiclostridium sp.]|nr:hypothetical protein [Ruminiclostridium sp.]
MNEDLYYKHCRNYDYDYCPIYKGEQSSGGCYLTSACVEAMGKADDCAELTVLRDFRDNWLAHQLGGKEEIDRYYEMAPEIVRAIHAEEKSKEIFSEIYSELVLPCIDLIQDGQMHKAWKLYRDVTERLSKDYTGK